jgi:hypothetical protein
MLVLTYLIFTPSDFNQVWMQAATFTPVGDNMKLMGFSDVAINNAQVLFNQRSLPASTITSIRDQIESLPFYDGGGSHPKAAEAEILVRSAKSVDRT